MQYLLFYVSYKIVKSTYKLFKLAYLKLILSQTTYKLLGCFNW